MSRSPVEATIGGRRFRVAPIAIAVALVGLTAVVVAGCAGGPPAGAPPLAVVPQVDMTRYAGDWYVIASIPTPLERDTSNAKESYALTAAGDVDITFSYTNRDGTAKTLKSRGFPDAKAGRAIWGVQFVWPIKADYRIAYLSPDYRTTVVAREKRDYVWIMARTPTLPEDELARLTEFVARQGYDVAKLVRVPQTAAG